MTSVKTKNHSILNPTGATTTPIIFPSGIADVDEEEIVFLGRDEDNGFSLLASSTTVSATTTPAGASEADYPFSKPTAAVSSDDANYYSNRAIVRRRQRARLLTPRPHDELVSFPRQQESSTVSSSLTDNNNCHEKRPLQDTATQMKIQHDLGLPQPFPCLKSPQRNRGPKKKKAKETIKNPKTHVFTPPQQKQQQQTKKLIPIATVVAEKSIVGTRPLHWTSATNVIESAKKSNHGINSNCPSTLGIDKSMDCSTTKFSPTIQHSTLQQQRVALRSAAAITTTSSMKKKKKMKNLHTNNYTQPSALSNQNGSSLFYPSFLADYTNQQRQHEEQEFGNDTTTVDGDDTGKIGQSTMPGSHAATTASNEGISTNTSIGPMMRELFKIRSNREGKQLRLNATSYSYNCSRFMKGDPRRTHMKHHVDVTLIGSFLSDAMSQVSSILAYVHEIGEVANVCFTPETIQDLKLHHGSQLRIYDCLRVQSSIIPTFICTSLAEPHPSGLPELPTLDKIPLPTLTKE